MPHNGLGWMNLSSVVLALDSCRLCVFACMSVTAWGHAHLGKYIEILTPNFKFLMCITQ